MKQKLVSFLIAFLASIGMAFAQTGPVSCYGQLQVSGNKIVGSNNPTTPVQVKGISLGWNCFPESSPFFTATHVKAMVGIGAEVIRVPMTGGPVQGGSGYYPNTGLENAYNNVIQAAIDEGVYVVIDWHSHLAEIGDEKNRAKSFFTAMAKKWGNYDNVIFEIYNEPLGKDAGTWNGQSSNTTWADIKAYTEEVIPLIRAHSDNLILVGTRNYSQCLEEATNSPLGKEDERNLAYVFHFYAGTHKSGVNAPDPNGQWNDLTTRIQAAMNKGKAVFVSEWGTVGASGAGAHDAASSNTWMSLLDQHKISSCAWQWAGKDEGSAFFQQGGCSGCTPNAANWSVEQLSNKNNMNASGKYLYDQLASHKTVAAWRQAGGCTACTPANVTLNYNYDNAPTATVQKGCVGSPAKEPTNPKRTGYKFLGWTIAKTGTVYYPFTANLTEDITLYAQWELGGGPTIVFDGSNENNTNFCTVWYDMDDGKGAGITAERTTEDGLETKNIAVTATGGNPGAHMAVNWKTVISNEANEWSAWGCGIGFSFDEATTEEDGVPVNMTGATGITFDYKGGPVVVQIEVEGKGQYETVELPKTTSWTTIELEFTDFKHTDWSASPPVVTPFDITTDLAFISKMSFAFKGGATAASGTFAVDNIQIEGVDLEGCGTPADPCEALAELITEATALNEATSVGTLPGNCTQAGKTAFTAAITAAEKACPSTDTDAVKTAIAQLKADIAAFKATFVPSENYTIIADCEDENVTKLQTYWSSYVDGTGTTIDPLSDAENPFTMTVGGANSTSNAAVVSGFLPKTDGTADFYPSAGISFPMVEPGDDNIPYDLTEAKGIGFWHKGEGITFSVMITDVTPNGGFDYAITVPSSTTWQYVVANFPDETAESPVTPNISKTLGQPSWMGATHKETKDWDAAHVYKLQWQVKDGLARNYDFAIDEVAVLDMVIDLAVVNVAELEALIEKAEGLVLKAVEGTEPGNYAVGSRDILNAAIAEAQAVADAAESQEAVDAAVEELQAAIDAFDDARVPLQNTIIADCEDDNNVPLFDGFWYAYNDEDPGGLSETNPVSGGTFEMTSGSHDGSNYAGLTYTLNVGTLTYNPFAGMGFNFGEKEPAFDFSTAEGVTFMYKGPASRFVASINKAGNYGVAVKAAADWEERTFVWSEFAQESWDDPLTWDASAITAFKWQVQGPDGTKGNIGVDDFQINGMLIEKPKPEGLVLAWNADSEATPIVEYQGKYEADEFATYVPKLKDEVTVTISGIATEDITDFKLAIIDDRSTVGYWAEYTEVKQIAASIEAGVAFSESVTLTISSLESADGIALSNPKLVLIGENAALAGTNGVGTEIIITNYEVTISIEPYVEGKYKLVRNIYSEDKENRGAFPQLALDPAVKVGDTVKVVIEGSSESLINAGEFVVSVMDETEEYHPLSEEFAYANETEIKAGVNFKLEFKIEIIEEPKGTGEKSQMIVLQDYTAVGPITTLYLDVFTATLIEAPTVDLTALEAAIAAAEKLAVADSSCVNGGKYPAAAVANLEAAIVTAKKALTATVQEGVDDATTALDAALTTFEASKITTDKTALEAAITAADALHKAAIEGEADGQYGVGSKAIFEDAIEVAESVLANACALKAEVDKAIKDLADAEAIFEKTKSTVDKTKLTAAIAAATDAFDVAKTADGNGHYPPAAKTALGNAITDAKAVEADAKATQAQVDAAEAAIKKALVDFEATVITTDKTALQDAIAAAEEITVIAGDEAGEYPQSLADIFDAALATAKTVNTNEDATQAEIDNAKDALVAATDAMVPNARDTKPLDDAIAAAEKVLADAAADILAGEYLEEDVTTFEAAIQAAKDALTSLTKNADIVAAAAVLDDARAAFLEARQTMDTKTLEDAITAAEKILEDNLDNIDPKKEGAYTEDVYNALVEAVADAEDALGKAVNQKDVIAAQAALENAVKEFINSVNPVDKSALEAIIAEAETAMKDAVKGNANGQYSADVYDALDAALKAAKQVQATPKPTQEDVDDAVASLQKAVDDFEPNVVDPEALKNLVTDAQAILDAATEGAANGNYEVGSKTIFETAIDAADKVAEDLSSSADDIASAITKLQDAIDAFEAMKIVIDLTDLENALTEAEKDYNSVTYGDQDGQKPKAVGDALAEAIQNAKDVIDNNAATEKDVADALAGLEDAMSDWTDAAVVTIDRDALKALIDEATGLLVGAEEGVDFGQYIAPTVSNLDAALKKAQTLFDAATATQAKIDAEVPMLEAAIAAFNAAKVTVDKSALKAEIAKAEAKVNDVKDDDLIGDGNGQYPQAKVTALENAIIAAQKVVDQTAPMPTQIEINAAKDALTKALDELESSKIVVSKDALKDALDGATALVNAAQPGDGNGQYPAGAIQDYKDVIAAAADVYNRETATATEVSNALKALRDAEAAFEKTKVVVSKDALVASIKDANAIAITNTGCNYNGCYTQSTVEALRDALNAAETVNRNASASQEEVDNAKTALDKAVQDLLDAQIIVTKDDLNSLITAAQGTYSNAEVGTAQGEYPAEAKSDLWEAIQKANEVLVDTEATQQTVDLAVEALREALDEFRKSQVPIVRGDKTDIDAKIDEAKDLYASTKEVAEGGNYENGSKSTLLDVMEEAQKVRNSTEEQELIDAAAEKLAEAIEDFLNSTVTIDKNPLKDAITSAKKELGRSKNNIGSATGQYPQTAVDALNSEIAFAEAILLAAINQEELTDARANLIDAIEEFKKARVIQAGLDDTALQDLIFKAQSLLENSAVYLECVRDGYPVSARSPLITAKNIAEKASPATQAEVDRLYADLLAATETFRESWTVNVCTGIDEADASELRVYPTVATNTVTVAAEKTISSVAVVALNGSTVIFEMPFSSQTTIDVTSLKQGNYIVIVTFEDNSVEQQTIIKK